jgi:hypothetical protein
MAVLITLKPLCLNGEIVQPGTMIRVEDEQGLINNGYARRLTKEESQAIVSEYVSYADKIFNQPQEVSPPSPGKKTRLKWEQGRLPL